MIGRVYERLTVVSFSHKDSRSRNWWNCVCSCGNKSVLHTGNLNSGNTKSCGCFGRDKRKASRKPDNFAEVTAIILGYQRHARDRGFCWSLNRSDVDKLIRKDCAYCGLPPSNIKQTKDTLIPMRYSGIDRVDSTVGYVPSNVVPCCKSCNLAKRDMRVDEFFEWALRLSAKAAQWGAPIAMEQTA